MDRKYNKYLELIEECNRIDSDKTLYGCAIERRKVINLKTLEIYESVREARDKLGVISSASITLWCQKHYGLMYLEDYEKIEDKENLIVEKISNGRPKRTFCKELNLVFNSNKEASIKTGISRDAITKSCNGIKTRNNPYTFVYLD